MKTKTNVIFKHLARAFLILVLACPFLAFPNRAVSARALAGPFTDCATQTQIPAAECDALLTLYTSTDGANWSDHTDWLQTDTPCSWFGVACENGTNVTSLVLNENHLSGPIPPQLANLTQLTRLDLVDKISITGPIPPELGSLTHLTMLNLYSDQLTGSIPPELGDLTTLTTLNLGGGLSGSIPPELGNLSQLTELQLDISALSGAIPPELGNLNTLTTLYLGGMLSGAIPPELGNLSNLTGLILDGNALSGSIPPELGNLSNLRILRLNGNALSGSIPPELGNLSNLTNLELSNNALSGSIPTGLGSLAQLYILDLSGNALSGSIPTEFGNLINLPILYLNDNRLSGDFPASIVNLTNLNAFTFDCELTSSDPDVIAFIDARVPGWQNHTCPSLVSPPEGASLDNGRLDHLDDILWDFDWSDVPGATKYQLYVIHAGAPTPRINNANIVHSSYHYTSLNSVIAQSSRDNWQWQVRAYVNDQWGDWSELRTFSVEPPDSDAPQALAKNGGFNLYAGASLIPTFWKAAHFSAADGKTTSKKQEGKASVKISGAAGVNKTLSQTLKVSGPAGDLLIFSYWVKGSAVPAGGVCQGRVSFYSGSALKGTKRLKCPSGANYNFKKMTLNIAAPAAYNRVVITFTYNKPGGIIWFDTVSLIR